MQLFKRICAAGLLFSLPVSAAAGELVIAREDTLNFPWQLQEGVGADTFLIERAARNLGYSVQFRKVPWKRCLNQIANNTFDGCFSASFKPDRLKYGVYPMINGQPDPDKRTHTESYSLYVLNASPVGWSGDRFENLTGDIGSIYGYSIIEQLRAEGAGVFEADSNEQLFAMLLAGRLAAVALLTSQADHLVQQNPDFRAAIRKIETPLVAKHYYLMLSHEMVQTNPDLVAALYGEIAEIRESAAYQDHYDSLFD
ncbi:substrate-binding periplasmic protein [Roseibium sp.]|uniref:substrate-binding periplasmic protein n=1 Tax=Roseibium sp. TaxID=1936156 RepID=UPI003D130AB1